MFNILLGHKMKEADLQKLIEKTQDVAAIAFLRDVVSFVKDIKPILESINTSISENVQKMPTATKKLSKVTEATEVATTEILNVVDGLFAKTSQLKKNHSAIVEFFRSRTNEPIELLGELRTKIANGTAGSADLIVIDRVIEQLLAESEVHAELKELEAQHNGYITNLNDDLTSIMMSLQVQDITSQQIAAVNHLLETIQVRLTKILARFRESELAEIVAPDGFDEDTNISHLHRSIAFDPDALDAISRKDSRQDDVDALLGKVAAGTLTEDDLKEDDGEVDIDALFANAASHTPIADRGDEIDPNDIDALFANATPDQSEEVSQDDIDALFGGGAASDEASSEDIDALFGN